MKENEEKKSRRFRSIFDLFGVSSEINTRAGEPDPKKIEKNRNERRHKAIDQQRNKVKRDKNKGKSTKIKKLRARGKCKKGTPRKHRRVRKQHAG